MTGASRALAVLLLWAASSSARSEPIIKWVPTVDRVHVEVSGLDDATLAAISAWPADQTSALLAVRVLQEGAPPMLGTWHSDRAMGVLRFAPQFPLTPGLVYGAVLDRSKLPGNSPETGLMTSDFRMPPLPRAMATVVRRIFPSADELPENLLKFYIHFSAPMSRGQIYEHIHLRDETGKEVELPFLEIDEELWDPEMKRLTLFIDPGRIKRGVRPLEEIGPALEQGRRFTLVIEAAWLDARGQPLAQKHERSFRVGPPDRTPIAPAEWKVVAPAAASLEPLSVTFPEPIDHALALRLIRVTREDGMPIEGTAALADAERDWSFTPTHPWGRGAHQLIIPGTLEDLAGNNVGRAFEEDLSETEPRRDLSRPTKLPFVAK